MSSSKKTRRRGRPPKYVLDDEGKEVVGLSYNHSNNMYYATGTNPRHYFTVGNIYPKEAEAIRQFHEWKKSNPRTSKELEEQNISNEIHRKAIRLIEEGYFNKLIEEEARKLIKRDDFVQEELFERAKEILTNKRRVPFHIEKEIDEMISQKAKEFAESFVKTGYFDKILWERVYDLMEEDPPKAARILGIKEIAYLGQKFEIPMPWKLMWEIFYCHKYKKNYLYDQEIYFTVKDEMSEILGNPKLNQIKSTELYKALNFYSVSPQIPIKNRVKIIEDVFITVKDAGYHQVDTLLSLAKNLSSRF